MKVTQGNIHKAKRGEHYDKNTEEGKKYKCFSPCSSGNFEIVDCWVCDEQGNVHPGYNTSGVPVHTSVLGKIVGKMGE